MADFRYYVVESDGHVASRHRTIKGAEVRCSYLNNHSRGKYRVEPAPWRFCRRCGYFWNIRDGKQFNYLPASADGIAKDRDCPGCSGGRP